MAFPCRGEIWLAALDPVVGHETGKTRPALVLSNDRNNEFSETVTVLPITSKTAKIYPFEAFLPKSETNLPVDSKVKANQIRTADKKRLVKFLGNVPPDRVCEIEDAVLIHLGIK